MEGKSAKSVIRPKSHWSVLTSPVYIFLPIWQNKQKLGRKRTRTFGLVTLKIWTQKCPAARKVKLIGTHATDLVEDLKCTSKIHPFVKKTHSV